MVNREELAKKIPYGYGKKIAERAGVSPAFVSKWMQGKADSEKVEIATLEILAELNQKKKLLLSLIF